LVVQITLNENYTLSVIVLNVIMLSVVKVNVIMLSAVKLILDKKALGKMAS
jgi:hypothetical protein